MGMQTEAIHTHEKQTDDFAFGMSSPMERNCKTTEHVKLELTDA
jgi:hypothetical protein